MQIGEWNAYADRMGLRRSTFYALARIWREKRDPHRVAGAGASKGRRARNETNDLPKASTDTIRTVIADLGPWAEDRLILRETRARLAATGGGRVSDQAIRLFIDQARASSKDRSPFPSSILVERCHLRLPLAMDDGITMPAACLAVALPENVVIAHRLGTDADPPTAEGVLADVRALAIRGAEPRPIIAPGLELELPEGAASTSGGLEGVRLRRVLGGSFGGIEFRVQRRAGGVGAAPRNRFEAPLQQTDIEIAVAEAIERHNAARGGVPTFGF